MPVFVMYSRARVIDDAGNETEALTFGPLSVLPAYWHRGTGSALMRHSIREAKQMGHRAIVICGHPDYYPRFGFRGAKHLGRAAMSLVPVPAVVRFIVRFSDLDLRLIFQLIVGDKADAHAPSCIRSEHPAKLLDGQLLIVDLDNSLPIRIWAAVMDNATQDIAARSPLTAGREILQLWLTRRYFDGNVAV